MWNSLPGGLLVLPEYSIHLAHYPFYYLNLGKRKKKVYKHVTFTIHSLWISYSKMYLMLQDALKSFNCTSTSSIIL